MKRTALIAVALCAVLLTTVGAGVVAAKQTGPDPLPGSTFRFDVTDAAGRSVGTLTINTNAWTYVFNGKRLDPGPEKTYYLFAGGKLVGKAAPNEKGNVHIQGAWDPSTVELLTVSATTFKLLDSPMAQESLAYVLKWSHSYWTDADTEKNYIWVAGDSFTHSTATGIDTPVHVQGTLSIYYWYDPTPHRLIQNDGEWKLLGTVHTDNPHYNWLYYDFQTNFQSNYKGQLKGVMQPDDPSIPSYWAYAS